MQRSLALKRRGWRILTKIVVMIRFGQRLSGMMTAMAADEPSSIQTRPSLLNRLKTGDDAESWQAFYRIYGKLVRDFSIQAGLTSTETDEVVQETAIALSKHLPEYCYDPKVCRFKTWLLNQTSWRIKDQLKKRRRIEGLSADRPRCHRMTRREPQPSTGFPTRRRQIWRCYSMPSGGRIFLPQRWSG